MVTVFEQENLILHKAFLAENGVLCVRKDDHLFHLKGRLGLLHTGRGSALDQFIHVAAFPAEYGVLLFVH